MPLKLNPCFYLYSKRNIIDKIGHLPLIHWIPNMENIRKNVRGLLNILKEHHSVKQGPLNVCLTPTVSGRKSWDGKATREGFLSSEALPHLLDGRETESTLLCPCLDPENVRCRVVWFPLPTCRLWSPGAKRLGLLRFLTLFMHWSLPQIWEFYKLKLVHTSVTW